jgi:diguanylate cyclase (GGDEF)-like protein
MVDPLTGISNRRAFLHDASLLAKRHAANPRPVAVLLIDLDHFKSINDRFGHPVGDRVLAIFADAARKSMRGSDVVGRLGGEEFAALLVETSREKAIEVAERIRVTFAQLAEQVDGYPVCATVSIGLVHCMERTLDVPDLLTQATTPFIAPRSAAAIVSRSLHPRRCLRDGEFGPRSQPSRLPPKAPPDLSVTARHRDAPD